MANYSNLKNIIDQVVRTNGQGEITGANLNQTLQEMVTSLGANYQYAGVATPSTNPGSPDQNVFYIATLAGTYTNFGGLTVPKGISVLRWNGSWSWSALYTVDTGLTPNSDALVQSGTVFGKFKFDGGAYNVSAHFPTGGVNGGPTYTFASAVVKIPQELRQGGVSFKYIDSTYNEYIQCRYLLKYENTAAGNAAFINIKNWSFDEGYLLVECPEWTLVFLDSKNRIIAGIRQNGSIEWYNGVPTPIKLYISELLQHINERIPYFVENPEYLNVEIDAKKRILSGTKVTGEKVIFSNFSLKNSRSSFITNEEWSEAIIGMDGRIIEGIRKNGTKYISNLDSPNSNYTHQSWLYGKNWVSMGDSITAFKRYTTPLASMYHLNQIDVSVGGARWMNYPDNTSKVSFKDLTVPEDVNSPANVIMNQVYRLLRRCTPTNEIVPEIDANTQFMDGYSYPVYGLGLYNKEDINLISIAAGVNDWLSTDLGNVTDFSNVNYKDCDKKVLVGALKWACLCLMTHFPKANIVLLAPIQAGDGDEARRQKLYNVVCKQIEFGQYFGFPVMDMYNIIPINREIDTPTNHRYLYDGLHPNLVGGMLMARSIASWLESILHYSYR